jgi:alanine-glyoxylate transaminase/serine-glyoxylate transaminase/serine-pyruvate transaminase
VVQVDTSTGVLTDVKSFAKAIREVSPQTLVVVDGVCATGSPRPLVSPAVSPTVG